MDTENSEEWYEQKPSWWKRNYKWFIPSMGCLSIILIAIFAFSYFGYKVFKTVSKQIPIEEIVQKAENNSEVTKYTSRPLEVGQVYNRSLNYNNGNLHMETRFVVNGPSGSGEINAKATQVNNIWHYDSIEFTPEDEAQIISIE